MIFVFHMTDKPDSGHIRTSVRPEHKAYLAQQAERMAFAGPLTSDDGASMIGSLLAIDFADRAAAESWLANEPFTRAGLYAETKIYAFNNLWPQKVGFPA